MSKRVQILGLASAVLATTVGFARELIIDTDNNILSVHNGVLAGGYRIAKADMTNAAVATGAVAGALSAADKTKLDGIASGATNTPLSAVTPAAETFGVSGVIGVSTSAARADHVHALVSLDATAGDFVALGAAAAAGAVGKAADAGHIHPYTGLVVQGKQTIWIPAGGFNPKASSGCSSVAQINPGAGSTKPDFNYLAFDPTTQQAAETYFTLPKSWDGTIGNVIVTLFWIHPATTVNFGVRWQAQMEVNRPGSDVLTTAFGGSDQATGTGGVTNELYSTAIILSALTGTHAAGDLASLKVDRVAANGADTLAVSSYLLGVMINYNTNAINDA